MESLVHDLRFSLRALRRSPGFAAVAVLTLALGIGANSALFSVVDAVLLQPLPYAAPERLARLNHQDREEGVLNGAFSPPDFEDLQARSRSFESLAAFHFQQDQSGRTLRGVGEPVRLETANVSRDFFTTLGVPARIGRTPAAEENVAGSDRVAVISYRLWRSRFGGDPQIAGRNVSIDGEPFTIIGVMPPEFTYPDAAVEMWTPISLIGEDDIPRLRALRWMGVIGRLEPGITVEMAQTETNAILRQIAAEHPASNEGWETAAVAALQDTMVGSVRPALLVLFAAVALVLLIASANLANLLLARATSRSREIAIRDALGAGRSRLLRQMLTESIVLALLGGALGLVIAFWGVDLLVALAGDRLPRAEAIGPSARMIWFTMVVSVTTGLFFGLVPALRATRSPSTAVLREGGRTSTEGLGRYGLRGLIVVAETALAMVLLIGAGLMLRSFWHMVNVDPGFRTENVVSLSVPIDVGETGGVSALAAQRELIISHLEQVPGVIAVGASKTVPLHGGGEPYSFSMVDQPGTTMRPDAGAFLVTGSYFEALGIPVRSGRTFARADTLEPVVVINESLARRYWPGEDAVGKSLGFASTSWRIIGVVGDVRTQGLTRESGSAVYVSMRWAPRSNLKFFVRTRGEPLAMISAIRAAVHDADPTQPIANLTSLDRVVSSTVAQPRLVATLLGMFGALALALAVLGIYGVISFNVAQRTREIGLRMALGADGSSVVRMVVARTARLSATGIVLGTVGALALTRVLTTQLYGVEPADPLTFVIVALLLGGAALLAGYLPARRAAAVDPVVALREE